MKSYYVHKLGCPKNDVDADYLAGYLDSRGLNHTDNPEHADLIIINSCGFIQAAKEESIGAVLELANMKKNGTPRLILTGCLAQRYAKEIAKEMPELDGVIGVNDFRAIDHILGNGSKPVIARSDNPRLYPDYTHPRKIDTAEPYAYLKISDGCDNRCSYCAIPLIRGQFRSRPMESVVEEARQLLAAGKKEIILVSQETTAYGRDIYESPRLIQLLDALTALDSDYWLRLMYLHPARLSDELIDYVIDNPRLCSYFDLPLQHISDRVLAAMNRRVNRRQIEKRLKKIRQGEGKAAIRTGFIIGFPGETEAEFEEMADFIEEWQFDRMGLFTYSQEDGTPAGDFAGQIDRELSQERFDRLMEIQQEIAFARNNAMIGRCLNTLIDRAGSKSEAAIGRTQYDAPEIDQTVIIPDGDLRMGDVVRVKIAAAEGYDLIGERTEQ